MNTMLNIDGKCFNISELHENDKITHNFMVMSIFENDDYFTLCTIEDKSCNPGTSYPMIDIGYNDSSDVSVTEFYWYTDDMSDFNGYKKFNSVDEAVKWIRDNNYDIHNLLD